MNDTLAELKALRIKTGLVVAVVRQFRAGNSSLSADQLLDQILLYLDQPQ